MQIGRRIAEEYHDKWKWESSSNSSSIPSSPKSQGWINIFWQQHYIIEAVRLIYILRKIT